jgi:hypothetical protein
MNNPNLADDMALKPSSVHTGLTAVAQKGGADVCWNCHAPLVVSEHRDMPFGSTYIRICRKKRCAKSAVQELRGDGQNASFYQRLKSAIGL